MLQGIRHGGSRYDRYHRKVDWTDGFVEARSRAGGQALVGWGDVNTCPARALPLRQSASARDSQTNRVEHGAAGAAVRRASSVGLQVHGSRGAYCG
jgi:hypothetical protein